MRREFCRSRCRDKEATVLRRRVEACRAVRCSRKRRSAGALFLATIIPPIPVTWLPRCRSAPQLKFQFAARNRGELNPHKSNRGRSKPPTIPSAAPKAENNRQTKARRMRPAQPADGRNRDQGLAFALESLFSVSKYFLMAAWYPGEICS